MTSPSTKEALMDDLLDAVSSTFPDKKRVDRIVAQLRELQLTPYEESVVERGYEVLAQATLALPATG